MKNVKVRIFRTSTVLQKSKVRMFRKNGFFPKTLDLHIRNLIFEKRSRNKIFEMVPDTSDF